MSKTLCWLLLVTVFQVACSQLVDDIVKEYRPKIRERQKDLGINIGLNGKLIGKTYGQLNENIAYGISNLTDQIIRLDNSLNNSIVLAQRQGRNIDDCVAGERAKLDLLRLDELRECKNIGELSSAELKLKELGLLQGRLGNLLSKCLLKNQLAARKFRSCLDNELIRIDDIISSINRETKSLTKSANDIGKECISARRKLLSYSINETQRELDQCVDAVLDK